MNPLKIVPAALVSSLAMLGAGCGSSDPEVTTDLTWHADIQPIVQQRCVTCHQAGSFAPFSLVTYEEVQTYATIVEAAVEAGSMPPWKPTETCADYQHSFDLPDAERADLLAWLDGGLPEGDPETAPPAVEAPADPFRADLVVQLPEAYTPVVEPDDYRCQLVDPGLVEPTWVTGLRVLPDQEALVHHTIVFLASADQVATFQAYDDAEPGPGYTCFGGPNGSTGEGGSLADLVGSLTPEQIQALLQGDLELEGLSLGTRTLGSWVPGAPNPPFPQGTGLRLEPGDQLIVQMHYNTLSSTPTADRSSVALMLSDEVDTPAVNTGITDLGWVTGLPLLGGTLEIPAGASEVTVSTSITGDSFLLSNARQRLGLSPDSDLLIHTGNLHMHQLGRHGRIAVAHDDGSESCILEIDDWDFAWQGSYTLVEPVRLSPNDTLSLSCTWDNSAKNQPIIDGTALEPQDVTWGEGTTDEMCLGGMYVTGP